VNVAPDVAPDRAGDDQHVVSAPGAETVARGVAWKATSVLIGQALWYSSLFVLAVLVPPRDFGVMAIGSVIVTFTLLVLESGTGGSLIIARDLSAGSVRRALIRTALAGVIATAIFVALAQPIADAFTGGRNADVLRVMALTVALAAFAIVPNALLSKHLRFRSVAKATIAAAGVASVAAVVAAELGAGVWALAIRIAVNQAVLTALIFLVARDLLPRRVPRRERDRTPALRPAGAPAFLVIALSTFLAWTLDNLVVGAFSNTTQLGLYALAFSLAFAPLTHVSWTIGQVLLPAIAAARDEELVRQQTLKALRMMTLLLVPLLPIAIALAPGLIPTVLGHKWQGMVFPFQILIIAGVGQGVLNTLGEAMAGAGPASAKVRAKIDIVWALSTIAAIIIGVNVNGIRGAAVAHVITFCGLAVAYAWRGGRGIGLSLGALLGAVGRVAECVAVQAAVTALAVLAVRAAHGGVLAAGLAGAAAGGLAFAALMWVRSRTLLMEAREVLGATFRARSR
jgi:O-antigen/teichoic acid export membrane protein